jgi:pimeloyl-ACP methyl ester carboxylesterase
MRAILVVQDARIFHRLPGHGRAQGMEVRNTHPVLLVHGLWDSAARLAPLVRGLAARGVEPLATVDLRPNDGRAPIAALGEQVCARADAVRAEHGCERIDLVGFSMGALACRYYLQRCGSGKRRAPPRRSRKPRSADAPQRCRAQKRWRKHT